ncbi:RICIN domain-containing protein [Bacillus sp. CMF21]|nr:RICIN domain-containing protein [Bacillus sp. CMF21]
MEFPMEHIKYTWVKQVRTGCFRNLCRRRCASLGVPGLRRNQQWRITARWDETYRLRAVNSGPAPVEIVMNFTFEVLLVA